MVDGHPICCKTLPLRVDNLTHREPLCMRVVRASYVVEHGLLLASWSSNMADLLLTWVALAHHVVNHFACVSRSPTIDDPPLCLSCIHSTWQTLCAGRSSNMTNHLAQIAQLTRRYALHEWVTQCVKPVLVSQSSNMVWPLRVMASPVARPTCYLQITLHVELSWSLDMTYNFVPATHSTHINVVSQHDRPLDIRCVHPTLTNATLWHTKEDHSTCWTTLHRSTTLAWWNHFAQVVHPTCHCKPRCKSQSSNHVANHSLHHMLPIQHGLVSQPTWRTTFSWYNQHLVCDAISSNIWPKPFFLVCTRSIAPTTSVRMLTTCEKDVDKWLANDVAHEWSCRVMKVSMHKCCMSSYNRIFSCTTNHHMVPVHALHHMSLTVCHAQVSSS